jgi:predicted transcriptional regulator
MDREKGIFWYLEEYGNTTEEDLVDYIVHNHNCSSSKAKKIVYRLVKNGQIYRVVHDKLKHPKVYITLEPQILQEELNDMTEAKASGSFPSETQSILEEAAAIARKRTQDKRATSQNTDV